MKVNYKFLSELKKFLSSEDWKSGLESRLEEINKELKITPEDNLKNKIENYKLKNEKDKSWNEEYVFNEKAKNKIIELHKIKLEKLSQEKIKIETCLENGPYLLGMAPFEDINNTKLLLANIHLLDIKLSGMIFKEKAVMAVKNMLKENFKNLYDLEVSNIANNNLGYLLPKQMTAFINKIIANKEIELKDVFEGFYPEKAETQGQRFNKFAEKAPKLLSFYKSIDPKIIEYSYSIMQFINQFYMNRFDKEYCMLADHLAFYFGNIDDIDRFLEKSVDFESFETIENSVELINLKLFKENEFSLPEIKIWREINGKYGKEAIKLFAKSGDLKSAGFDICKFAESNAIEEVYKKAQEISSTLKYKDEDDHKELAKIMHEYNYPEKTFDRIVKEVLLKQKKDDLIPNISFKIKTPKNGEFTFSKLKPGAFEGLFLGKESYSCQSIDGDGEKCAIDGFTKKDAGFYVIRNKKGKIIAQSYAWIGLNKKGEEVLVLDSFEYVPISAHKDLFVTAMKELEAKIKKFGFSELYVGIGGRTPKLTSKQNHKVVEPKDKSLYQYGDSKYTYKITQDICLKKKEENRDKNCDKLIVYKDFTEFCDQNIALNWGKIIGDNEDSKYSFHYTVSNVLDKYKLFKELIHKQIIPFEMIAPIARECGGFFDRSDELTSTNLIELIEEAIIIANKDLKVAFKWMNIYSQYTQA